MAAFRHLTGEALDEWVIAHQVGPALNAEERCWVVWKLAVDCDIGYSEGVADKVGAECEIALEIVRVVRRVLGQDLVDFSAVSLWIDGKVQLCAEVLGDFDFAGDGFLTCLQRDGLGIRCGLLEVLHCALSVVEHDAGQGAWVLGQD